MKVFMILNGLKDDLNFPRDILKIDNENIWLEMLNTRNLTSYVYDENTASKILNDICEKFWCELEKLYFCIV